MMQMGCMDSAHDIEDVCIDILYILFYISDRLYCTYIRLLSIKHGYWLFWFLKI